MNKRWKERASQQRFWEGYKQTSLKLPNGTNYDHTENKNGV